MSIADRSGAVRKARIHGQGTTAGQRVAVAAVEEPWRPAASSCRCIRGSISRASIAAREWSPSDRRALNHAAQERRPGRDDHPRAVDSGRATAVPEAARAVQFRPSRFGPLYAEHGFYGIMKVSRWRDAYEEAVYQLARRIVDAAEASPVQPEHATSTSRCRPHSAATRGWPGRQAAALTVVAPAPGRAAERPGSRLLRRATPRVESVSPELGALARRPRGATWPGACRTPPTSATCTSTRRELLGAGQPAGPEVLLIDPWAVLQPECRQMLRRLDALDKPWVQVVVVWNQQDAEMQAEAEHAAAALEAALPSQAQGGPARHRRLGRSRRSRRSRTSAWCYPTVIATAAAPAGDYLDSGRRPCTQPRRP